MEKLVQSLYYQYFIISTVCLLQVKNFGKIQVEVLDNLAQK
jgi:hypothetical protein